MLKAARSMGALPALPPALFVGPSRFFSDAKPSTAAAATEAESSAIPTSADSKPASNPPPVQLTATQQYELKLQYFQEQERRLVSTMDRMRSSSGTMAGAYSGTSADAVLSRRPGQRHKDTMARVHAAMDYKARIQQERAAAAAAAPTASPPQEQHEEERERATDATGKAKSWFSKFF